MSEEVRQRIFEPFYTTKPVGKGTGLGLSIVFRTIEDHGGSIEVRSMPGTDSAITIHLPLRQTRAPGKETETAAAVPAQTVPPSTAPPSVPASHLQFQSAKPPPSSSLTSRVY